LKGIISSSLLSTTGVADISAYAIFTDVLQFIDWIEDPKGEAPKCGVMSQSAGLVQGGSFSTREQFPWQVSIAVNRNHAGSGSLISNNHVLTAAHIVCGVDESSKKFNPVEINRLKLIFGALSDKATSGSIQVGHDGIERISVHPNARFGPPHVANVAIISLKSRLKRSSFISPVCLWEFSDDLAYIVSKTAMAVGYGIDETGKLSGRRKHISVIVKSHRDCMKLFGVQNESKYFCAQGDGTDTPCNRDDPLYMKLNDVWYVRGIISMSFKFSDGRCKPHRSILYEDVAFYTEWIKQQISEL